MDTDFGRRLKISIVTPSFNHGLFIEDAIRSVVSQGYPSFEHIVLDNCSTDNTAEILKRYPHLKVICEPDNGQSDALNKGFNMVRGDIVGWLNADDQYLPGCFENVNSFFNAHPECDILYGDYRYIDANGHATKDRREIDFDIFILKYLHILYVPTPSSFFRRNVFDDGNRLNTHYNYSMDYDLFLRLALKGYRFRHIDKFLANFRRHGDNKSLQAQKVAAERIASLLAHDPFLRSLPPMLQYPCRLFFTGQARLKRQWKKIFKRQIMNGV